MLISVDVQDIIPALADAENLWRSLNSLCVQLVSCFSQLDGTKVFSLIQKKKKIPTWEDCAAKVKKHAVATIRRAISDHLARND